MFVGRDRERTELVYALDDAQAGRGGIYLIAGEPGVGKTRLALELERIARERGVIVAWGRCTEEGGQLSFTPWIELGRSVMEQMPGELSEI